MADRNSPQKHVWRARIILATAQGCGTAEIMRRAEVSKPCVWRWQERFMREGVAGLVRDKTRKPGLPPLPPAVVDRVVALTLGDPPGETTHWTGRAMAAASGDQLALGAADLGGARPAAASGAALQAVHRSGVRGQAARRGRPLSRSAGAQPGALGRRKIPDPGARPDAAGVAAQEGPGRHHDARLHPPRHDDPVRGAERARRQRDRPVHGAAPAPGVHPLPQCRSSAPCRPAS